MSLGDVTLWDTTFVDGSARLGTGIWGRDILERSLRDRCLGINTWGTLGVGILGSGTYIKNPAGQEVLEKFYTEELSKTQENNTYLWTIEKALRSRKKKGIKVYFVKWYGKTSKFNSWITKEDLI